MASKARQLAQSASAPDGRKNIVINGAMNVCQRATSVSGLGDVSNSGYHVQDRFDMVFSTSGRFTVSQDSDAPAGFSSAMKLACTTADTSIAADEFGLISYQIEGQDLQHLHKGTSSAKELTLSFYAKANASKTYVVEMRDYDNSRIMSKAFTVGTSYSRIELTFPADTTGELDNDNARSFAINIFIHAGSTYSSGTLGTTWAASVTANRAAGVESFFSSTDNTFFITGIQLEVGSVATEFEHRTFAEDLQLCQRYFYNSVQETSGINAHMIHILGVFTTIRGFFGLDAPVPMRSAPTIGITGSANLRTGNLTAEGTISSTAIYAATFNNTRFSIDVAFGSSTANTFRGISLGQNGGFLLDAEL
tara:strand:- start:1810 stop:2901 length:1092 start_codon:yes stop_codon:yes gene_type:complete